MSYRLTYKELMDLAECIIHDHERFTLENIIKEWLEIEKKEIEQ